MPGMKCIVLSCRNYLSKTKKNDQLKHIQYHVFPKDEAIRKQWIDNCLPNRECNVNNSRVCSVHFTKDSFHEYLTGEGLNFQCKRKLRRTAIPTLLLDHQAVKVSDDDKKINPEVPDVEPSNVNTLNGHYMSNNKPNQDNVENLRDENSKLKERLAAMQNICNAQKRMINSLHTTVRRLKKGTVKKKNSEEKAWNLLGSIFTANQINILMKKRKYVHWTNDELSIAFTLSYLSRRAYIFVKRTLKVPLPHLSTLKRWASSIEMQQGFLEDVIKCMKVSGSKMNDLDKVCSLMFDEMKIKKHYEYDVKNDRVVGPHSYMQVVMARGIFSKWKQPVYVGFDTKITKTILDSLIIKLSAVGYKVKACVCDMGGGNVGLWKEIQVSKEKSWFINPVDGKKVFIFPDAPHLLKLIRNWFIDTGFLLENGKVITKEPVEILLEKQSKSDLKICPNLTNCHLELSKIERQNVRKAAQLLSHSTAVALKTTLNVSEHENVNETAEFIETVSKWFQLMNTFTPKKSVIQEKNAYGKNVEEQNQILDKMEHLITTLRCGGKLNMQLFQKGVIISIKSLKGLMSDLKKENPQLKYILTHRLNQDAMENLFSQVRTRGGLNDHPTPLNALNRLKLIILGRNNCEFKNNQSDIEIEESNFILATLIKSIDDQIDLNKQSVPDDPVMGNIEMNEEGSQLHINESSIETTEMESNALEYLAGWVAKKCLNKNPELGFYCDSDVNGQIYENINHTLPFWIKSLTYGGLVAPSKKWMQCVNELENAFQNKHGSDGITNEFGIVKSLCETNVSTIFSEEIIQCFFKQRIFIRMNYLNGQFNRKRVFDFSKCETTKKLAKIIY